MKRYTSLAILRVSNDIYRWTHNFSLSLCRILAFPPV